MAKTLTAMLVISILTLASCKKSTESGNSWTFQGTTYYVSNCDSARGILTASDINANNYYTYSTIAIYFYISLPTAAGTYAVAKFPPAANQVSIIVGIDGSSPAINYNSTGGNGTETVNVTVSNGLVTASGRLRTQTKLYINTHEH